MAKRPTQKTITSGFSSASMLNYNVNEVLTAFDNTLSLDGSAPNAMGADFDMNSNDILNAGDITAVNVTVTGTLTGDFDAATIINGTVAPTTEGSDGDFYIDTVTTTLYGPKATTWPAGVTLVGSGLAAVVDDATPQLGGTLDANGNTIDMGTYVLTDAKVGKLDGIEALADVTDAANVVAALDGATLDTATVAATDLVLTKDVGTGNLQTVTAQAIADLGSGGANLAYTAAPTNGTVTSDSGTDATLTVADATNAGLMVPEYFTRLASVEAAADVTDTTNVTAAGALMDSEVTNLAEVKAFASADYATAAQGTLAANALPKSGGAMTGAITTNSTFDGRDVATDGTKLDTIETSADVTDTTNVTAAGALMDSEVDADIKTLVLPASTTISTFGASLVDDATAAAAATTLGLGTGDSPTFTSVTVTGGTVLLNGSELSGIKVTIADDAVATLTFPTRQGGFLFITANAQGVYPRIADMGVSVPVDFGASPGYSTPMWLGSAMEMNNAAALNGTTGTDGKVTVGTAGVTGTLYIENRMGSSFPFFITLL